MIATTNTAGQRRHAGSTEMKVIGGTRERCMISGQENVLVNQRSKLCELAVRPQAMVCTTCFFVMVHDIPTHICLHASSSFHALYFKLCRNWNKLDEDFVRCKCSKLRLKQYVANILIKSRLN